MKRITLSVSFAVLFVLFGITYTQEGKNPPDPELKNGTWYHNDTNAKPPTVCVIVSGEMSFKIDYVVTNGSVLERVFYLPGNNKSASSLGHCGNEMNDLTAPFDYKEYYHNDWKVEFQFTKVDSDYRLTSIALTFNMTKHYFDDIKDEKPDLVKVNSTQMGEFNTRVPMDSSYQCVSDQELGGFNYDNGTESSVKMTLKEMQFQAFRTTDDLVIKENGLVCEADAEVSNLVPIIVGAALAALVVIVLIAYLIGRKRSGRGYESV